MTNYAVSVADYNMEWCLRLFRRTYQSHYSKL